MTFASTIDSLLAGDALGEADARTWFDQVFAGEVSPVQLAALLTALRTRPVTSDELVGFASAMRAASRRLPGPAAGSVRLDNCGTGGAPCKTANISTAAALLLASAGIEVAKHGNRSYTRPSGSADILEASGVNLELTPETAARVLADAGIVFLFAPSFHPAMRFAGPVRQELGIKTVFNLLGPLTNPAGANCQVLGVYHPDLIEPMAEALARLGCQSGFVLHGCQDDGSPGFDEATPAGPIRFAQIENGAAGAVQLLDPRDLGFERIPVADLAPPSKDDAATVFASLIAGTATGPLADCVTLNVAFGLVAAGKSPDLQAAVADARTIQAAGAGDQLGRLVASSGTLAAGTAK